jgi:hypothetical protein
VRKSIDLDTSGDMENDSDQNFEPSTIAPALSRSSDEINVNFSILQFFNNLSFSSATFYAELYQDTSFSVFVLRRATKIGFCATTPHVQKQLRHSRNKNRRNTLNLIQR